MGIPLDGQGWNRGVQDDYHAYFHAYFHNLPCFHVEQDTSRSASHLPTDHPKRVSAATDATSQRLDGEQTGFIPEQVSAIQMRSYVRVA